MVDLHRHDMFSRFDGYGQPLRLAKLAKELGHTSLATSNHGTTSGLVQTAKACKDVGIKAILGVEGYFLPKYKEKTRGFHLGLYAKDLAGYRNINVIQTEGERQKYYNPIWTFDLLEKRSEGLICTTGCVGGYLGQSIARGRVDMAEAFLKRAKAIFGDDLYVEIQPYVVSEEGLQEKVNEVSIRLAEKFGIKCILTSDSHYGSPDDFETYLKMHELDGHDLDEIERTYGERYMPTEKQLIDRFNEMHGGNIGVGITAEQMIKNLKQLEDKVEDDILDQLDLKLPVLSEGDNLKAIVKAIKDGLKKRGQYTKEYIDRCKRELDVIKTNGFVDYFLIVADYVNWAKDRNINVGPGRGSVCNCLVAYAMHITEVDSIKFDLDFRRFLRYDKKGLPDIDIDFEMDRRQEVIDYLMEKYDGHSSRVSSYGLYQASNTINELAKVCGLPTDKDQGPFDIAENKAVIDQIKRLVNQYKMEDGSINIDELFGGPDKERVRQYDLHHDGIITHFSKLFGKIKFVGTHAAGVLITSGDIMDYTALRIDKEGVPYSVYNLEDLDAIGMVKFDILGLKTMQSLAECRRLSGNDGFDINVVDDPVLLEEFRLGNTMGVFQFEKDTAKRILGEIECDSFNDVVATCAMNRPGPLSQGTPERYADNKKDSAGIDKSKVTYQYTKESYGTIVYQEQLLLICVELGGLEWSEADVVLKANKHGFKEKAVAILNDRAERDGYHLKDKFVSGCISNGVSKEEAQIIWDSLLVYSFNKGHAAGYCIISMEEMYYKKYHPELFWYSKLKYARDDKEKAEFATAAAADGLVVFLPHVNYSKQETSLRKVEGTTVLQNGLADMKGVGLKAADVIYNERLRGGPFISRDDFLDRCKSRVVTKRVIDILTKMGALEFSKSKYIDRVTKYNATLYGRNQRKR